MGQIAKRPSVSDLPVTETAFNDYLVTGQRMAADMAREVADEIRQMKGRDKVNCWARFTEVFFVTIPKGATLAAAAQDRQRDSLREFLCADEAEEVQSGTAPEDGDGEG